MAITPPGRRQEPLHVVPMALLLVLAAFAGGALGLIWQSARSGGDRPPAEDRLLTQDGADGADSEEAR
ncbi:MAG: hypothetical protein H5U21_05550 [Porphyrobacter sp.]|nr:hypothetical protein [Porphyrobacter sp.]